MSTAAAAEFTMSGFYSLWTEKRAEPVAVTKPKPKTPPPWAPADGRAAKYTYQYYPGQEVYHRASDGLWFYSRNGRWFAAGRLPAGVTVSPDTGVEVAMDSATPYAIHEQVKKVYPKANPTKPATERIAKADPAKSDAAANGSARHN